MQKLLMENVFDNFLIVSFSIDKDMSVIIDGERNKTWYDTDSKDMPFYLTWKEVRDTVAFLIKGKRSPLRMKAVFRLSKENTEKLLLNVENNGNTSAADTAFCWNMRFEEGTLIITTGVSSNDFRLIPVLNEIWDKDILIFLKHFGIVCLENR